KRIALVLLFFPPEKPQRSSGVARFVATCTACQRYLGLGEVWAGACPEHWAKWESVLLVVQLCILYSERTHCRHFVVFEEKGGNPCILLLCMLNRISSASAFSCC